MSARDEDWAALGIEPDADIATIKRAYRHRRSLYEPNTLATHSLLDDDEREHMIERIEAAYQRIMETEPTEDAGPEPPAREQQLPDAPQVPAPDPEHNPGGHLRHLRLTLGLSIDRIAAATKIGAVILKQIEDEDFDSLPAPVFVRGHVVQFAREIGIEDVDGFARTYLAKMNRAGDEEL